MSPRIGGGEVPSHGRRGLYFSSKLQVMKNEWQHAKFSPELATQLSSGPLSNLCLVLKSKVR